jgi:hypothetical protein
MKASSQDRLSSFLLILLLALPGTLPAEERLGAAQRPEPRQVFAEILTPYRNLNDYTVKIQAEIDIPTIRVPNFSATLYFKKPDRFHVETRRFAPIPRNSGVFNPFLFDPGKNLLTYLRTENLGGTPADIYRVEPIDGKTPVRYYTVWVGGPPAQILQVESVSFQGTKALVKISLQTVAQGDEKWLLPGKTHIHLAFPEGARNPDSLIARDSPVAGGMRRLDEMTGEGDITITYTDWRVNTGLDDGIFKDGNDR